MEEGKSDESEIEVSNSERSEKNEWSEESE